MPAVADGTGGHAAGEIAVEPAVVKPAGIVEPSKALLRSVEKTQKTIVATFGGMGTTLTTVPVSSGTAHWAHTGVSLFQAGSIIRITDDHTIPGMLFKRGEITKEQTRLHSFCNVLLQYIGCEKCAPDTGMFEKRQGDLLMVSSDGEISGVLAVDGSMAGKLSHGCSLSGKRRQRQHYGGGCSSVTGGGKIAAVEERV